MDKLQLPPYCMAKRWAQGIVEEMGDGFYANGSTLPFVVEHAGLGAKLVLATEFYEGDGFSWRSSQAAVSVEVAIWPSTEFVSVFSDPERNWRSLVPLGSNQVYLDRPATVPVLVRVRYRRVSDLEQVNYTLFVVEPEFIARLFVELKPETSGLTTNDVAYLVATLGLEPHAFVAYSADGVPEGLSDHRLAVQLPA